MRRTGLWAAALIGLATGSVASGADATLFSSASFPKLEPTWSWVAGAAAVGLAGGFALGWRMLAGRIRKKYGGLKIY
jgi:hypothetical protein